MIISAGGVVLRGDSVLLLQTKKGRWVLPKGHLEAEETTAEAALREVYEESGVVAKIEAELGWAKYRYYSGGRLHSKKVFWYKMRPVTGDMTPLRAEGFVDVRYFPKNEIPEQKMYESELIMVQKALA
ncbi:NUDIX domain-containing protein [Guggenheimella bovis]